MTLALLITAVGGAWAADTYTITFKANNKTKTIENVTLPHTFTSVNNQGNGELDLIINDLYNQSEGWCVETPTVSGNSNVTAGLDGSYNQYITISAPFEGNATVSASHFYDNPISSFTYTLEISVESPTIDVKWDAATKTGTFVMPAFDVEIAPIYAPVAKWAVSSEVDQIPTAIDGIIAGETKAIVNEGTVAKAGSTNNTQGTVMYLTTTDANMTAAQARNAATGWTSTVPTGAVLTGGFDKDQTVYVWYYIQGANTPDEQTATAENTFNDSEICTTPLTVTLKANQFNLTFSPAPVSNATVTVGGNAATAEQLNAGKIEKVGTGTEIKLKAATGYKFKKVEVKKTSTPN